MNRLIRYTAISAAILTTTLLSFVFADTEVDALTTINWVLRQPPYEVVASSSGYPYFIPWVEVVAWGGTNRDVIYAGNTDPASSSDIPHGIYRSADGGLNWTYLGKVDEKEEIRKLVVHPTKPNIVFAGFQKTYYEAGIYRSEDSGNNWAHVLSYFFVKDIEIDPTNPNVIYAVGYGNFQPPQEAGVFRSTDEGKTWEHIAPDIFSDVEVHPLFPNILFAARNFSTNPYEGIYRSDDFGQTWKQISDIRQGNIIIDDNHPEKMFIFGEHYQGIWKTNDGGQTWQNVTSNLPYVISWATVQSAIFDPEQTNTIWIGLKYDGMYVSRDGGETWQQESNGLPFLGAGIFGPMCISSDIAASKLVIACDGRLFIQTTNTISFEDVPADYWAWNFIERLYSAGITGGCSTNPLTYCPEATVTRAQMAVFLLRGIHGPAYNPPAVGGATGFGDVPAAYWAAAWIKQLAADGITGGCGTGIYCPESPVTRAEMAVFLLRSKHGASYTPPAVGGSTGFTDVPPGYWAAAWIKQLVAEGITAGCGTGTYCPESPVTRAQMAVFLVRTFNLP